MSHNVSNDKRFCFCFSTVLVQLILAGLPVRSCLDFWGTLCAGVFPNVHFCCCNCCDSNSFGDSNPCRGSLYNKWQCLNNVSHCDPPKDNQDEYTREKGAGPLNLSVLLIHLPAIYLSPSDIPTWALKWSSPEKRVGKFNQSLLSGLAVVTVCIVTQTHIEG